MAATTTTARPSPAATRTADAYREMRTRLHAFLARRVSSPETAEDLTQDVMLRLIRHGADDLDDPVAWLYRVARNALIDHYRRRPGAEPVGDDHRPLERTASDPFAENPAEARRELSQCLPPLLEQLPEPYRSAVRAVDLDGSTHAAAARLAGISVPGMKSRVQRGRQHLRRLLTDCCTVELSATRAVTDYRAPTGCAPGHCG
jgi:RNA polymerase sigma-70 factor (ECF subfamily)